jgi:hypothetical protein
MSDALGLRASYGRVWHTSIVPEMNLLPRQLGVVSPNLVGPRPQQSVLRSAYCLTSRTDYLDYRNHYRHYRRYYRAYYHYHHHYRRRTGPLRCSSQSRASPTVGNSGSVFDRPVIRSVCESWSLTPLSAIAPPRLRSFL